jgi:long-subunit acyl-CoA synthetase (AMP-forming)
MSLAPFAERNKLDKTEIADLYDHPMIKADIDAGIAQANSKLSRVEQVKKYRILPVAWDPAGDEVTPTMKLKRKAIAAKYEKEIEALYA